jgi:hypothetical protein
LAFRAGQHVIEQGFKHAAPPKIGAHIDALQPPKIAVAPIAPFVGNHQLSDHRAARLGHEISAFGRVAQQRIHTGLDHCRVQGEVLGLFGQFDIESCQNVRISGNSFSDGQFDALMLCSRTDKSIRIVKVSPFIAAGQRAQGVCRVYAYHRN